ncbi:MAG TPA: RluA family pseudouridine synthase [Acidimicrobiia bacterium]|nr:RluA family pseudouridine synthase [Acidimicrobiia bacterium]
MSAGGEPGATEAEEFPVPRSLEGERLDRAVALITGYSRADVQDLIVRGAIRVDGEVVAKSRRLHEGETISLDGRPEAPEPPRGEAIDLEVRHEDADLVVIAKPAGMVVHPGAGGERETLVHGVLHRWPAVADVGDPMRPGIVHRLDRDTSGLLAVALSQAAYDGLVAALAQRRVERRYLALVWGHPEPRRGVVDAPIGRSMRRPTRMAVTPRGREARTQYEVLEIFRDPEAAFTRVELETGRTHQIRVHLAAIGHAVVGDPVYGRERSGIAIDRPFLHAWHLAFDHPVTGERIVVEESLPPDLDACLAVLRATGGGSS